MYCISNRCDWLAYPTFEMKNSKQRKFFLSDWVEWIIRKCYEFVSSINKSILHFNILLQAICVQSVSAFISGYAFFSSFLLLQLKREDSRKIFTNRRCISGTCLLNSLKVVYFGEGEHRSSVCLIWFCCNFD